MSGSKKSTGTSASRILGLDALRGLAVLLMMQQHLGVWFWVGPDKAAGETNFHYPVLLAFNALGGGAAPMFIILAGAGCALLMARRSGSVDRMLVLRGLTLMAFGYLLNLLTPSWFSWRSWYVLHLMGLGMCLVPFLRRLSNRTLLGVALAIIVAAPLLQSWLETPKYMSNARMAGWVDGRPGTAILPGGALRLAAVEGQFSVFPWMALFVSGFVAGRWVLKQEFSRIIALGAISVAVGGLMLGLYFGKVGFARDLQRVFGFNIPFFPSTTSTILVIGGLVMLSIGAIFAFEKRRPLGSGHIMVCLGRASLTLLLLHVWVFRELRPGGLWKTLEPTDVALVMIPVILVFALLAQQWRKVDYRYGAEWLLRIAGGKSVSQG